MTQTTNNGHTDAHNTTIPTARPDPQKGGRPCPVSLGPACAAYRGRVIEGGREWDACLIRSIGRRQNEQGAVTGWVLSLYYSRKWGGSKSFLVDRSVRSQIRYMLPWQLTLNPFHRSPPPTNQPGASFALLLLPPPLRGGIFCRVVLPFSGGGETRDAGLLLIVVVIVKGRGARGQGRLLRPLRGRALGRRHHHDQGHAGHAGRTGTRGRGGEGGGAGPGSGDIGVHGTVLVQRSAYFQGLLLGGGAAMADGQSKALTVELANEQGAWMDQLINGTSDRSFDRSILPIDLLVD
jgi:hypothetical protein